MLKGVDVSKWQGIIDHSKLLPEIDFIIIKASGGDNGLYTDSAFGRNRDAARKANKPRGFYHFAGRGDAKGEAEHFARVLGPLQKTEIAVLDWETTGNDPVGWCLAFMIRLEELLGVAPMFYTNMGRVRQYDWSPLVERNYGLWGAIWDNDPNKMPDPYEWPFIAIKQYSDNGRMPGIAGAVDLNSFNGDKIENLLAYGKKDGSGTAPVPQPIPAPPVMQPRPTPHSYTIKRGDNLSAIAAKHNMSLAQLLNLNPQFRDNPNKIYPGQIVYLSGGQPATPVLAGNKYIVKSGDTLSKISARYGTSIDNIVSWNRKKYPQISRNYIQAGWVLRVT